jgi:hypothetical protein
MSITNYIEAIGDRAYSILANSPNCEVTQAAWSIIHLVDKILIPYGDLVIRTTVEQLERQAQGSDLRAAAPGEAIRNSEMW